MQQAFHEQAFDDRSNSCHIHSYLNTHTHSTLSLKHSIQTATRNTHTHVSDESPEKTPAGRPDNCHGLPPNIITLYGGETESQATSCQVYSQKQTKNIYIYTHIQICMFVCIIV